MHEAPDWMKELLTEAARLTAPCPLASVDGHRHPSHAGGRGERNYKRAADLLNI
jgi:hypothetical protein